MGPANPHHSSWVMLALLLAFAVLLVMGLIFVVISLVI